jgi:hypothetical protein
VYDHIVSIRTTLLVYVLALVRRRRSRHTALIGARVGWYVCIHVYMYMHMYVYMFICMYACLYVCIHVFMHVCMFICMCTCICIWMCTCICICMCTSRSSEAGSAGMNMPVTREATDGDLAGFSATIGWVGGRSECLPRGPL